jgi:hypothetical protein
MNWETVSDPFSSSIWHRITFETGAGVLTSQSLETRMISAHFINTSLLSQTLITNGVCSRGATRFYRQGNAVVASLNRRGSASWPACHGVVGGSGPREPLPFGKNLCNWPWESSTQKKIFKIDHENPGFLRKRPPFKILATPLLAFILLQTTPKSWISAQVTVYNRTPGSWGLSLLLSIKNKDNLHIYVTLCLFLVEPNTRRSSC